MIELVIAGLVYLFAFGITAALYVYRTGNITNGVIAGALCPIILPIMLGAEFIALIVGKQPK